MASLYYLGLALTLAVAVSASPARIIGGREVPIQSFPSLVQVEALNGNHWVQYCGGTILNVFHILSAAQCFFGPHYSPQFRRVRAGSATSGNGGLVVHVQQEFNHPSFGRNGYDGDISVIRLSSHLPTFHPIDNTIRHAFFMGQDQVLPDIVDLDKVGWGITSSALDRSEQLRALTVRIVDHNQCRLNYQTLGSYQVTDNMLCATSDYGDSCTGDQGGPLMFMNQIIVGVISWSYGCNVPGFPGVSTNVAKYANWIIATLNS